MTDEKTANEIYNTCREIFFRIFRGDYDFQTEHDQLTGFAEALEPDDHMLRGAVHNTLTSLLAYSGYLNDSVMHCRLSIDGYHQAGLIEREITVRTNLASIYRYLGQRENAINEILEAQQVHLQHLVDDTDGGLLYLRSLAAELYISEGNLDLARSMLRSVISRQIAEPTLQQLLAKSFAHSVSARLALRENNREEAISQYQAAKATLPEQTPATVALSISLERYNIALLRQGSDEIEAARTQVLASIKLLQPTQAYLMVMDQVISYNDIQQHAIARDFIEIATTHIDYQTTTDLDAMLANEKVRANLT